jgi:hypothetical protein
MIRAPLALAALALAAWLGVQAVGARAQDELTDLALKPGKLTPAELRHADALVERAGRLSPDRRPQMFRALLEAREGDRRAAVAGLASVARAEPENVQAWALLARLAAGYDDALAARARARVRVLAPPVR